MRRCGIIKELYPGGVPNQVTEPNVNLCQRVSVKLKEARLPNVSDDTILRAAGYRVTRSALVRPWEFISLNFLAPEEVAAKLERIDAADWISRWLKEPENVKLAALIAAFARVFARGADPYL